MAQRGRKPKPTELKVLEGSPGKKPLNDQEPQPEKRAPNEEDDKYYVLPYLWLPEDTLDLRVRRDHVLYDIWKREGHLETTEGNVIHYGFIERFIEELGTRFNIQEIAFDRRGAGL